MQGKIRYDARTDSPTGSVDLRIEDLPIDDVFRGKRDVPSMEARLSGTVQGKGSGDSLHELLASADGSLDLVLGPGTIRESLAEVLGVDLRGSGWRCRDLSRRSRFAAHGHDSRRVAAISSRRSSSSTPKRW